MLGSSLPLDTVMELKPIFAELSDESLLEKCLMVKLKIKMKVLIQCFGTVFASKYKEMDSTKNEEKYAVVQQSKTMTKMNSKKDNNGTK